MLAVSVADALRLVGQAAGAPRLRIEEVPLADALGRVLARDVRLDRDAPPFDRATMDGYAVRASDASAPGATLRVIGRIGAGAALSGPVGPGEAAAIMTGAPLPEGADAVVPFEVTEPLGGAQGSETSVRLRETTPRRNVRGAASSGGAAAVRIGLGAVLAACGAARRGHASARDPRPATISPSARCRPADPRATARPPCPGAARGGLPVLSPIVSTRPRAIGPASRPTCCLSGGRMGSAARPSARCFAATSPPPLGEAGRALRLPRRHARSGSRHPAATFVFMLRDAARGCLRAPHASARPMDDCRAPRPGPAQPATPARRRRGPRSCDPGHRLSDFSRSPTPIGPSRGKARAGPSAPPASQLLPAPPNSSSRLLRKSSSRLLRKFPPSLPCRHPHGARRARDCNDRM
jgi:hypothetical protein